MNPIHLLDVWLALGLDPIRFEEWIASGRGPAYADEWAQLLAAIRGDVDALCRDSNPPAPTELVDAARRRQR